MLALERALIMRGLRIIPILALLLVACDDEPASQAPASTASTDTSASAAPSASASATIAPVTPACMKLNQAIWDAAELVPRACKKDDECELAGPGRCVFQGRRPFVHDRRPRPARGKPINEASDQWKAGGCEGDLKPPDKEKIFCKAGSCSVTY